MNSRPDVEQGSARGKRRRWFLGVEPIFEGGRQGKRTRAWDVEDELVAVDVDVFVAAGDHVELSGGVLHGDLRNEVSAVLPERRDRVVRIHGHTVIGDVTVRVADGHR